MKIGILTFHWATNYGAILQSYALQRTLIDMGHDVEIIDYKPKNYDLGVGSFFHNKRIRVFAKHLRECIKERSLKRFRLENLRTSRRLYTAKEVEAVANNYDIIISGSDQVMNPSFLCWGEEKHASAVYFLGFKYSGKRVAYAVSFGCTTYPDYASDEARRHLTNFDAISVREQSGVDIVKSLGRDDAIVVPDPTALMDSEVYRTIASQSSKSLPKDYGYLFFIRNIEERIPTLRSVLAQNIVINNSVTDFSMSGWLKCIANASYVVTDSFHAMMMAIKFEKPFAVVTNLKGNVEMNDRFYSLLDRLGLCDRIIYKDDIATLPEVIERPIDWKNVKSVMAEYGEVGREYLRTVIK